ncbi:MAG: radical SAM protein [Acidobacteriota bacterium]
MSPPPPDNGVFRLVPSRYNIRAVTEDGRLVIWNSYKGKINIFRPDQRDTVEGLLSQRGFESSLTGGLAKYLYERGFLIKAGTNEYRRIRQGFGKQQYRGDRMELILLASEDCNFRCEYCYEEFARGTMVPGVREGIKHLVRGRLSDLKSLAISWFGGEPLYGFQAIEDLAPFFVDVSRQRSISFSSHMTTNGYLLTPDVAEKLLAWEIRSYQITLDGAPEDHDRNRPTRDGQGTFSTIFENLLALKRFKQNYRVDLRVNYDPQNHVHVRDLLQMVRERFEGDPRFRIRFRPVGRWGGPNDEQFDVCGREDAERINDELRAEALRRGIKLSDSITEIKGMGARVCYAARPYNLIIGATGKVMKCTVDLDKKDRNVVGSLSETGELVLDEDKLALWTEPAFESDTKCQKCVVLPTCQGISCPIIRFDNDTSPCIPLRHQVKKELRELAEYS